VTVTFGSSGVNPASGSKGLIVASDPLAIYEAGSQYQVTIEDVSNNPVALKMVFNELNQLKRELAAAKQGSIPPGIAVSLAILNALGVVIVAFGSAYVSMRPEPPGAAGVLALGAVITLVATVTPAALSFRRSKRQKEVESRPTSKPFGAAIDRSELYEWLESRRRRSTARSESK
jgi:hypothetical protein